MLKLFFVFIGGGMGSLFRYLISQLPIFEKSLFPIKTLCINMIGCFLIGLLLAFIEKRIITNDELRLLLITGFCGGFTTFSTFANESKLLISSGHWLISISYIILSILLGISFVFAGKQMAGHIL